MEYFKFTLILYAILCILIINIFIVIISFYLKLQKQINENDGKRYQINDDSKAEITTFINYEINNNINYEIKSKNEIYDHADKSFENYKYKYKKI
jgi:uncharacterized protein YpmS